ncbi:MAG TPA: hypothetical protein PKJ37_08655 [Acidobacteriota bacterium]|mgnify:CR=1 FL=1|nr:hypothetical protein [Acidobacteriota bacterium]HNT17946.1 hypothetical protein [Acidobacteriota bacterium]
MCLQKIAMIPIFVIAFVLSPGFRADEKNALSRLNDLETRKDLQDLAISEEIQKIWQYSRLNEPLRCEHADYQINMIKSTLALEDKHDLRPQIMVGWVCSFGALKYLVEERSKRDLEQAVLYCAAIVSWHTNKSCMDDPIASYFAQKAYSLLRESGKQQKLSAYKLSNIYGTIFYCMAAAPYKSANDDAWALIDGDYGMYFDHNCLDWFAVMNWRLKENLSNDQVDKILHILEKIDLEKKVPADFILLVAKDKNYAIQSIEKMKIKLNTKDIEIIQKTMDQFIDSNIFS